METLGNLKIRRYGSAGPTVIVLHGGPAATGSAQELARGLSDGFRVIEPWQRGSGGDEPLSVARHVADLHELVREVGEERPPALIGESWGAMLALAYAAAHPHEAGPIALVGCGTFDRSSRARGVRIREERIAQYLAEHPEYSSDLHLRPGERIMKWQNMTDRYDPLPETSNAENAPFDMQAFTETWKDMLHCQESGLYPAAFAVIHSPVIMLHGAYDPHPGKMIRDSLKPYLPQLEYREFEKCGHHPAIERHAREAFFTALRDWLAKSLLDGVSG
jgi:pimeloyl-ACP methyl ester carboxylesterase